MNRLVLAEALVKAGLTLMVEAEAREATPLQRATKYRNALMIALLACCPIRLKNFAALTLGKSLCQIDSSWWIVLGATETKERRPDERRVPDFLSANMERYLSHYRAILGRSDNLPGGFWLSSNDGRALSYLGVETIIMSTTEMVTGVRVSPHLFRMSAATTAATHAGTTPHLASALLDHRDARTTNSITTAPPVSARAKRMEKLLKCIELRRRSECRKARPYWRRGRLRPRMTVVMLGPARLIQRTAPGPPRPSS